MTHTHIHIDSRPPAPQELYEHDGGRVSCLAHSGYTLQADVLAFPERTSWRTERGTWDLLGPADLAQWELWRRQYPELGPLCCEECGAPPLLP